MREGSVGNLSFKVQTLQTNGWKYRTINIKYECEARNIYLDWIWLSCLMHTVSAYISNELMLMLVCCVCFVWCVCLALISSSVTTLKCMLAPCSFCTIVDMLSGQCASSDRVKVRAASAKSTPQEAETHYAYSHQRERLSWLVESDDIYFLISVWLNPEENSSQFCFSELSFFLSY